MIRSLNPSSKHHNFLNSIFDWFVNRIFVKLFLALVAAVRNLPGRHQYQLFNPLLWISEPPHQKRAPAAVADQCCIFRHGIFLELAPERPVIRSPRIWHKRGLGFYAECYQLIFQPRHPMFVIGPGCRIHGFFFIRRAPVNNNAVVLCSHQNIYYFIHPPPTP